MSDRPTQPLVRSHEVRAILVAYLLLLLLAAAVNVPLAVALQRGPRSPRSPALDLRGTAAPSRWPASTPHAVPWPAPNSWSESTEFGYRKYDVRAPGGVAGRGVFTMDAQLTGWPLAVVAQKQMWWDWDDPALKGPDPGPVLELRLSGLVLNPLILGATAFAVFIGPRILYVLIRRVRRLQRQECVYCGYPIRTTALRCPECGSQIEMIGRVPSHD